MLQGRVFRSWCWSDSEDSVGVGDHGGDRRAVEALEQWRDDQTFPQRMTGRREGRPEGNSVDMWEVAWVRLARGRQGLMVW